MWNYLKRIYDLDNAAKRFQLEVEIANYKQDTCVGELLREEQRLATQGTMSHDVEPVTVAYAAQSRALGIQGTGVGEGDREGA
ncbi:hypothetical protein P8452_62857 [Trifolium repens]|nr:hypothetical protein P8452_00109 [Trifolium repens]WJX79771.1 hypothetical protein P8452_62857 [Trifolium repens]